MTITYVNNLGLSEMGTGDNSGTWGTVTNTNLELIGQALGHGTRAIANASTDNITMSNGTDDDDRALYLKLTGGGQACTVTLLPATMSKVWIMENGTAAALTFTQGSGANVTIPAGDTKVIACTGGAGTAQIVYDVFASLSVVDLKVQDDLTVTDDVAIGGILGVTGVLTTTAATVFNGGFAAGGVGSFANGSVSAPAITNTGDLNTGMFFPADETIGFTSGGVASFNLNNQGNIVYVGSMQIQSDAQTGLLALAGGNDSNDGANIGLHGPSHASLANITRFRQDTVESFRLDPTGAVFNEGSADLDFRVESNGNANMLFVDGGRDKVFIGKAPETNDGVLIVQGDDNLHPVIKISGASANGFTLLSDYYQTDESSMTIGSSYSGGAMVFARGVKVSNSADNTYLSTQDTFADTPSVIRISTGSFQFLSAASSATTATDSAVTMVERLKMTASETTFNDTGADTDFRVESNGNANMFGIDANRDSGAGQVYVGANDGPANVNAPFHVGGLSDTRISIDGANSSGIYMTDSGGEGITIRNALGNLEVYGVAGHEFLFNKSGIDVDFRVASAGHSDMFNVDGAINVVAIGKTNNTGGAATEGAYFSHGANQHFHQVMANESTNATHALLYLNRQSVDNSTLVNFMHADTVEGSITVNGSTVSYNGFSGRHESSGIPLDTPLGTVVSTIDELDVYPDRTTDVEGNAIDHLKAGQTRTDHPKVEVSNSVGDSCVYGYVSGFDGDGKLIVTSVGIGSVRVTGACAKGDLLESNGNGTAKVQSDDIVRSKTIGKVTIGNSDTGVKLVSCVMYCG